jgi:hypothetical protein
MPSDVDICNLALAMIGADPISQLEGDDLTPLEVKCAALYDSYRDTLLEDYDWDFAVERSDELAADSTDPTFGPDHTGARTL